MPARRESSVLVFGDLALDIRGYSSLAASLEITKPILAGDNASCYLAVSSALGGTAWNFARAVKERSSSEPLIVATVGRDSVGHSIKAELRQLDVDTAFVATAQHAPTSVIYSAYFAHGQRLLLQPAEHANSELDPTWLCRSLNESSGSRRRKPIVLVWISGYCLIEPSSRLDAVREACEWARAQAIPIFVDLVPHAFLSAVGDLDVVERLIGPVAGVVAETATVAELGLMPVGLEPKTGAEKVARTTGKTVIIQEQVDEDVYAQGISQPRGQGELLSHRFAPGELPGLGDHMAVMALTKLGFLLT